MSTGAWIRVRVVVLAAAVLGLVFCPTWVEDAYRDRVVSKQARPCPTGRPADAADDCVERAKGEVVDMGIRGCPSEDCTENHRLRIRHGKDTDWLSVDPDTYSAARRGGPADLRLWHGTVTRVDIDGHSTDFLPSAGNSLIWRLAGSWLLLGAAVGAATGTRFPYLIAFVFGWLLLTLSFVVITDTLLLGTPGVGDVLFTIVLAVPGLVLTGIGLLRSPVPD